MRGPGLRLKIDVRRKWRCPRCQQERRVAATETTVRCQCTQPPPQMQLIEELRKVRVEQPPLPAYVEFEELLADEPGTESGPVQNDESGVPPAADELSAGDDHALL